MNRAYSLLNVKFVDTEQRKLRGTATTPTPDRIGDIIEPLGVQFKNPMPLLWQHDHRKPVGWVNFSAPTKDGIEFEATLPQPEQAGNSTAIRERIEEAWQSVKMGLVRAVSIGYRAIEVAELNPKEWFGQLRFLQSEVMELSLVTIPANAEAVISEIKSIDGPMLAALGKEATEQDRPQRKSAALGKTKIEINSGASEKTKLTVASIMN